jgi:Cytochrome c554 and c-prime
MSHTGCTGKCFALVFVIYVVPQLASGATDVRNTSNNDAYVGSRACLACHSEIYRSYKKTGMGRSMSLVDPRDALLVAGGSVTVKNQKRHRWFNVLANETGISQSEFELDSNGREIFRDTHSLAYAVGSGHAGRTYLVRRGSSLFEAPLSYYSRPAKWDLSPGYKSGEVGFSRRVNEACLNCHTGRVNLVLSSEGSSSEGSGADLSVSCENCHGPSGSM